MSAAAIFAGAILNALADAMAALEEKSPCERSAGISMLKAGMSAFASAPASIAAANALLIISLSASVA